MSAVLACAAAVPGWFVRRANRFAGFLTGDVHEGRIALYAFILFPLTVVTTLFAGLRHAFTFQLATSHLDYWDLASGAAWFSGGLLCILGSHEWGHFHWAGRWRVARSLPCFIPIPSLTGTLGAAMRIGPRPPSRRALFDIAAAGPIAGFVVSVPAVVLGLSWSRIVSEDAISRAHAWVWGESVLTASVRVFVLGPVPEGSGVALHPLAIAGMLGLLLTSINLFPVGALDGGHIGRALAGTDRGAWWLSTFGTGVVVGMAVSNPTWFIWAAIVVLLWAFTPAVHIVPSTDEEDPGFGRRCLTLVLGVILTVSFCSDPFGFR